MIGQQMVVPKNWKGVYILLILLLAQIILLIFKGPSPSSIFGLVGLGLSIVLFFIYRRDHQKYPKPSICLWYGSLSLLILIVSFVLSVIFLAPLSEAKLNVPSLTETIVDPDGIFSARVPAGWDPEMKVNQQGSGYFLHPATQDQYFGASELQVFVRKNDTPIPNADTFLEKMAEQLRKSDRRGDKESIFDIHVDTITLLDGTRGLISEFSAKRIWIPVRQVTIIGIKKKQYICTVSAIGLSSHATLYRVICLGIHKTVKIQDKKINLKKGLQFNTN